MFPRRTIYRSLRIRCLLFYRIRKHHLIQILYLPAISGAVQSVETLVRAAAILKDQPIRWHFLGNGAKYADCVALAHTLELDETVQFYGRLPVHEMPAYYAMADALLVSMAGEDYVTYTLPGKVQSYMAAGKPILGSISGEAQDIITEAKCGYLRFQ